MELLCAGAPALAGTPAAALVTRILYAADVAGAVAVLAEAGAPTGREEEEEGGEAGEVAGGQENAPPPPPAAEEEAADSPPRKAVPPIAVPPSPLVEGGGGCGRAGVEEAMAGLALSPAAAGRGGRRG